MDEHSIFGSITIGTEMGPVEICLDEKTVKARTEQVQWETKEGLAELNAAPPGITINEHARMNFREVAKLKAAIWAKSEHEFIRPFKIGAKVYIRGKVVDKYIKNGRYYLVSEYETRDANGHLLMKSRETGLIIE